MGCIERVPFLDRGVVVTHAVEREAVGDLPANHLDTRLSCGRVDDDRDATSGEDPIYAHCTLDASPTGAVGNRSARARGPRAVARKRRVHGTVFGRGSVFTTHNPLVSSYMYAYPSPRIDDDTGGTLGIRLL